MSGIRGPKRKAMETEVGEKRSKMEEMAKQEVVDENLAGSYSCPLCSLELNCMPGDRVMKRHIMDEHFTPGSLLEMVGLDLDEGQKLRCPYPDCKVGDKPMKLLLLNVHLEWNHNRLRKLVEKDTREGMEEVFQVMYDIEGYKKKSLESLLKGKMITEVGRPIPVPLHDATKFELSEEEEEDVDDPSWNPKAVKPPAVVTRKPVAPKVAVMQSAARPKVEMHSTYTIHSSVSTPLPCLLCKDSSGKELRLVGGRTSEVTEHYKLCLYKLGRLQASVPPELINTNAEGEAIDEMGRKFVYKCKVPDCDRARRGAKSTAYREYVFHCYQSHGLMKLALEDSMENTNNLETKQKFQELLSAVVKPEEEEVDQLAIISEPGVEEIHTCLLCKGITRETKKENKEAKILKYNICITRNHYANCLNETEEGRIFFETTYMTGLDPSQPVKIKCEDPRCKANKRFREGFTSHKMFYNHMALFHGGLEMYMRNHQSQEVRDLVQRLPCHKLPDVCFVPDHYGQ